MLEKIIKDFETSMHKINESVLLKKFYPNIWPTEQERSRGLTVQNKLLNLLNNFNEKIS